MVYNLKENPNPKTVISFGAGVQSTAMTLMTIFGDLPKVDYIVFSDTGWETPGTYSMLSFYNTFFELNEINLVTVSGGDIKDYIKSKKDLPLYADNKAIMRRQCTNTFKIKPMKRFFRQILGINPEGHGRVLRNSIDLWLGISWDEAIRVSQSRSMYIKYTYPLVDFKITRQDCIKYIQSKSLPVPEKSGCVICPYHSNKSWKFIKDNYPDEFERAIEFDKNIRPPTESQIKRGFNNKMYLHKDLKPLSEINLDNVNNEDFCESGFCFM